MVGGIPANTTKNHELTHELGKAWIVWWGRFASRNLEGKAQDGSLCIIRLKESQGMFAGEIGTPRLLKLFKKYDIKTTWFIPGESMYCVWIVSYLIRPRHYR